VVLGADTVCVVENDVLGQPSDADHARAMIQRMENTSHEVLTGVALLNGRTKTRLIFAQRAIVRVGHIGDQRIEQYLSSNHWHGKAGAYNLEERIEAGWPIEYAGDPTTVMGLPMDALSPILTRALALPSSAIEEVTR
jgi:nucleoside triphosphate pyrophosphatase